ncbi:MAG: recombination protein RecR [Proteobacteria bacterium]|nr:recombination protein RecR [Pseudomonadota bacterium]NIS70052.1 recombination protein RecR [Pseudomonadota bacterium]
MVKQTPLIDGLIDAFSRLPGIGRKTASRLAFHILRTSKEEAEDLAAKILDVKRRISVCSACFDLTDEDPCPICQDSERSVEEICVVEEPNDLLAIENSGAFKGKYHVLHGTLRPLEGVGPEHLKIKELLKRLEKGGVKEVVIATNPTREGGTTAVYLTQLIKPFGIKVTRIASGVPVGSEIEYTDSVTLSEAMEGRREV